jgi:hypothetical protein
MSDPGVLILSDAATLILSDAQQAASWVPPAVDAGVLVGDSDNAAGVLPLKKWM